MTLNFFCYLFLENMKSYTNNKDLIIDIEWGNQTLKLQFRRIEEKRHNKL